MRILYVTTVSDTVNTILVPHMEMLLDEGHVVDLACNLVKELNPILQQRGCEIFNIEFQRTPFAKKNYLAYKKLSDILMKGDYDIVHVHTPVAAAYTRLACKKIKSTKVIYTAHGFHFYKGAPIQNWLLYFPAEKWLSRYTDVLITINHEDHGRANKSFKAKRTEYVSGVGIDIEKFSTVSIDKPAKRIELGLPEKAFVVLSFGELNRNKNHETVIRAIAKLKNPNIYYLICGSGPLEQYLRDLSKELEVEEQVILLGFRHDIPEICKAGDVFALPSYREGLPLSIMEAMTTGLPIVCSEIRGNKELIENEKGGYLVKRNNIDEYTHYLRTLMNDPVKRKKFGDFNREKVQGYSADQVLGKVYKIYTEVYESKKLLNSHITNEINSLD